jgi:cyclophilin family peptidyl-prolyl cis-trans isomerase
MEKRSNGWIQRGWKAGIAGLLLALAGCNHGEADAEKAKEAIQQLVGGDAMAGPTNAAGSWTEPRMHQSFAEATRKDPPADWQRPPDLTLTAKSVGKLYGEVVDRWDSIDFVSSAGKRIAYSATIDTELGPIEIELRPDLAPNHVRNFVALALVGYYDGLVFERTVRARAEEIDETKPEDQPLPEVELIEGGCPIGTGDMGVGSLGYWLKPEFSKDPHEAGTLGACHGSAPDTAACRFYITLNKAPFLDEHFTVFGKVTGGLDVARRVFSLPVHNDPEYPEGDRPEKPVVINRVTIHPSEVGE